MDPVYGYQSVNVEAQQRSPSSLLSWMKRLIGVRRSNNAFGRGTLSFIRPANRTVLAYVRQYENETILCVANLSRSAQAAEIDLSPWKGRVPLEMLGRTRISRASATRPIVVTLAPYGFFWFLLGDQPEPKAERAASPREFTTLVWTDGWNSLLGDRERHALEHDVLPAFLLDRRWFADKARGLPDAQARNPSFRWSATASAPRSPLIGVPGEQRAVSRYLLPLMVKWTRLDRAAAPTPNAVAAVRRGPREGTLLDAGGDQDFITLLLRRMHAGDDDRARTSSGWNARRPARSRQMPLPEIDKITVAEPRAVQHHGHRRRDLRGEDFPQGQRGHPSRRSRSAGS